MWWLVACGIVAIATLFALWLSWRRSTDVDDPHAALQAQVAAEQQRFNWNWHQ